MVDGDAETYWKPEDGVTAAVLEFVDRAGDFFTRKETAEQFSDAGESFGLKVRIDRRHSMERSKTYRPNQASKSKSGPSWQTTNRPQKMECRHQRVFSLVKFGKPLNQPSPPRVRLNRLPG